MCKPPICGSEFIREGSVEADEDVSNVLASSRMNSLPRVQVSLALICEPRFMPKPTDIRSKGRLVLPLHRIKNEAANFLGLPTVLAG